jgi:hypothetical protein
VYVTVEDSSATLTLNGKPVKGSVLFALEKLDVGQYTLVARTAMMVGSIDIVVGRNEVLRVDIPLKPATGTVKFLSDPMGAQIFVNRQLIGQTPFKSTTLQVGEIKATFHKLGFFDTTVSFALGQDQEVVSKLTLTPVGNLVFEPETPAQMTLIQGRDTLVRSGDKPIGLRPGSWRLLVRDKAWQPLDTVVQIKKGRTTSVALKRYQARVSIIASPEAEAWLDGVALGPTPHILDTVAPGTHTLILRQQGYKDAVRKITVTPGQVVLKRITLENRNGPTPEELESRARDE